MNNETVAGKRRPSPGSCLHEPAWPNLKLVREIRTKAAYKSTKNTNS
jgi:hypothetical protein